MTETEAEMKKRLRQSLVDNIRFRFKETVANLSDDELAREYSDFSMSDMYGNNDERFPEWLGLENES